MIGLNPIFIIQNEKLRPAEKVLLSFLIDKDLRNELKKPLEVRVLLSKLMCSQKTLERYLKELSEKELLHCYRSGCYYDVTGEYPIQIIMVTCEIKRKNINNFFGIELYNAQMINEQNRPIKKVEEKTEKKEINISDNLNDLLNQRKELIGNK